MPTNSNESPLSTSTTATPVPSMTASTSTTATIISTSVCNSTGSLLTATTSSTTNSQSTTKQLNKLKRFLSTLYYFGSDISIDVGERIRALILALVNNALSIEEFHAKVQTTTSFPLRPFALPFLKSTVPLLQKDLSQLSRQSKQSTSQYLAQHEEFILLPREVLERSCTPPTTTIKEQINENLKRKLSEENHARDEYSGVQKRPSITLHNNHHHPPIASSGTNNIISSTSVRRDSHDKERSFTTYLRDYGPDVIDMNTKNVDDDWRHAENMLNCILEMVTKAKRILFALQQKDLHFRRVVEATGTEWKRRHSDLLVQTEDRINEVRRKAEETVLEIKRQAMIDLQKAVSQTEQKSNEILLREREQFHRINQEIKAQSFEEAFALLNRQEDGPEQCWHCGRRAIETCSGCNLARYCGQYCQHRDWDSHQKLCGPDLKRTLQDNPQLLRNSKMKQDSNMSVNRQIDIPLQTTTRISIDTPHDISFVNVSSPSMVQATDAKDNSILIIDNKTEREQNENEIMTVKDELV